MDDEVEDLVGDVKYTDSQKSVTTSAVYSLDFTDSSPERNSSSGKETYIIECDDSDESEKTFRVHRNESIINLNEKAKSSEIAKPKVNQLPYNELPTIDKSVYTNIKNSIIAHEFTQTSKTIIELARNEIIVVHKPTERKTLETQTSILSIIENKTTEYNIRVIDTINHNSNNISTQNDEDTNKIYTPHSIDKEIVTVENTSSSFQELEIEDETSGSDDNTTLLIDDELKESEDLEGTPFESTSEFESTKYDSDMEDDSLIENGQRECRMGEGDNASETSEVQDSIQNDVEDLYNRISEIPFLLPQPILEPCVHKLGTLTPVTEETLQTKGSILDLTPNPQTLKEPTKDTNNDTLFVNSTGMRVKTFLKNDESFKENSKLKLPVIHRNKSSPLGNGPHLNFLFSLNTSPKPFGNVGTLPCLHESRNELLDRWEINAKELASGESPLISGLSDSINISKDSVHLPPIHVEGSVYHDLNKPAAFLATNRSRSPIKVQDAISIQGRIRELKMTSNQKTRSKIENRSCSPRSVSSRDESRLCDAAEKCCDNLCLELLRRLRSPSWIEITSTLEEVPKSLEKYWPVITVNRIADLLRQVIVHIESPRTQVARTACTTLAEILKNTNYTRKPDFYEAMSILLSKTGSYCRPVRRAANVALDDIVCRVDLTHSVTAVCVYGVGHKSALVRCAAARLLVVCCALAEGGRQILRGRPPTAANARRHVLRALAELLHDKNIDTRKYAERLYRILRPLPTFEAYFLTDVDVEIATQHMKKYDQILLNSKQAR